MLRFCLMLLMLWSVGYSLAQEAPESLTIDYYLIRAGTAEPDMDEIYWVDVNQEISHRDLINGKKYTVTQSGLLYLDLDTKKPSLLDANGEKSVHPVFAQLGSYDDMDWLYLPDLDKVIWTVIPAGTDETVLYISDSRGMGLHHIYQEQVSAGILLLPIAYDAASKTVFVDYQPRQIRNYAPYPLYAGLQKIDLSTQEASWLINEPGCFCGASIDMPLFARFELNRDSSGFDLIIHQLKQGSEIKIDAVEGNYTQASNLLLAPNHERLIYVVAKLENFNQANEQIQSTIVYVDLATESGELLFEPISELIYPLRWQSESEFLYYELETNSTHLYNLESREDRVLSQGQYLGRAQVSIP
ncbi:hypothetical protein MASR2M15_00010 [Anaerolineales bacterium]